MSIEEARARVREAVAQERLEMRKRKPTGPAPRSLPSGPPMAYSTSQAAEYLGVSIGTIRRWNARGWLAGSRTPGGELRFSVGQLDACAADCAARGNSVGAKR